MIKSRNALSCNTALIYRLRPNLIVRVSLMPDYELWFTNKKQPSEGISVSMLQYYKSWGKVT